MTQDAVSGLSPGERTAIERYFEGDRELFLAFRSSCIVQFQTDFATADAAIAASDRAALRRTVHSLKSVLQTLGRDELSASARQLEDVVQEAPWAQAVSGWGDLRQGIAVSFALPSR